MNIKHECIKFDCTHDYEWLKNNCDCIYNPVNARRIDAWSRPSYQLSFFNDCPGEVVNSESFGLCPRPLGYCAPSVILDFLRFELNSFSPTSGSFRHLHFCKSPSFHFVKIAETFFVDSFYDWRRKIGTWLDFLTTQKQKSNISLPDKVSDYLPWHFFISFLSRCT